MGVRKINEVRELRLGRSEEKIEYGLRILEDYILKEKYSGYDPFDALCSPLFRLPFLTSNKVLRFGAQQIVKRLPINLRPLAGIAKGYNPVTLGLCLQGMSYWRNPEKDKSFKDICFLVDDLNKISSKGFSGYCWGYDFDWEARYAKIPAFTPTVVATGIGGNGLFEGVTSLELKVKSLEQKDEEIRTKDIHDFHELEQKELSGEEKKEFSLNELIELRCKIERMILGAAEFVRKDLRRSFNGEDFCFSYSPMDEQKVLNASMKGVRILMQAYAINKDNDLVEEAERAVRFVGKNQRDDGSWAYAVGDSRKWSDSFHTGYILDSLKDFIEISGKNDYSLNLDNGFNFFRNNFIGEDGFPRYYNDSKYPADCTSGGQIILTLLKFNCIQEAIRVAEWMVDNMQDKSGYFYYQQHRYYTNKISYMRWSNAWMYVSLCKLLREAGR